MLNIIQYDPLQKKCLFGGVRCFSATHDADLVVIGTGPGGYVAAIKAAQLGMKVYSEYQLRK